jgi:hypothetical protein
MLHDCVTRCPPHLWESRIAHYRFCDVAYHVLSFTDYYLSPTDSAFVPRDFHPPLAPGQEFNDEPLPDPPLTPAQIHAYILTCRQEARDAIAAETEHTLAAPAAFRRREKMSRAELHLYNLRHLQHHTGQLSAHLRRTTPATNPRWIGSGWK